MKKEDDEKKKKKLNALCVNAIYMRRFSPMMFLSPSW